MVLLADTLDVERGLLGAIKDTKTQYAAQRDRDRGGRRRRGEGKRNRQSKPALHSPDSPHVRRRQQDLVSAMYHHRHLWANSPTKEALRIVRKVIHSSPKPLTVNDVYKLALQQPSSASGKSLVKYAQSTKQAVDHDGPLPPNGDHTIRSMRFVTLLSCSLKHSKLSLATSST